MIQKTSQPVTLMVHKARNLWNMRLKVTEHSIQDYIKRKKVKQLQKIPKSTQNILVYSILLFKHVFVFRIYIQMP